MKYFSFIFFLLLSVYGTAQSGLVAHFNFDQCGDIVEVTGTNNTAFQQGFPDGIGCACGVKDSALVMNGAYMSGGVSYEDIIFLIGNYNNYFDDDDFTISMFFKSNDLTGNRTLFSKLDSCSAQTGISLRYTAATNFITAFVGENSSKKVEVFGKLNLDRCWHHVALVKKGNRVLLYADGELLDNKPTVSVMDVRNDAEFSIGWGKCVGITDFPFDGYIDELRVYNRGLTTNEVLDLYFPTDVILNRNDTLIIEGSSVDVRMGSTCAESFKWLPITGVDDPLNPNATITPPSVGNFTYVLEMAHPEQAGCILARDTINITVVDPDSLDCGEIFIPKAFTPNGDGLNDKFGISNPYAIVDFVSFEIFDRWGGRVFYSEEAFAKWDGTFNGKKINPGVCMYRIVYNCKGEEKILVGGLTVLR